MAFQKDSRKIKPGDIYISIFGKILNGNDFITDAIKNGAKKVIVQKDNVITKETELLLKENKVSYEYVENCYLTFSKFIFEKNAIFFNNLIIIGITGTKGKTSLTYLTYSLLLKLGHQTAMMSSAFHEINGIRETAFLTTESPEVIHEFVSRAKKLGVTHLVLEVSAHAFSQYRIYGIEFDICIFNNFSQEHAEYYLTQEDYFNAKTMLYSYLKKNGAVILNYDDKKIYESRKKLSENQSFYSFSCKDKNTFAFYQIQTQDISGTSAIINFNNVNYAISTRLLGLHNIANISAALTVLFHLKLLDQEKISCINNILKTIPDVPGRGERYFLENNTTVYIDKSYTTNSIEKVLLTLRPLTNKLVVLFGCGGERDAVRRPQIASLIESIADVIYVAPDNPRREPQENIFQDIAKGFNYKKNIYFYSDRENAIKKAIGESSIEKIVVLLGKGDEQYQEINGIKHYFSEKSLFINNLK